MLIEQIKMDNINALKEKNQVKRDILSIVVGKYMNVCIEKKAKHQDASDDDMLAVIQKTIKETNDSAADYAKLGRRDKVEELNTQIEILKSYLPKQLTADEIRAIIVLNNLKTVPEIMKYFKTTHPNAVDMKLLSEIAREAR